MQTVGVTKFTSISSLFQYSFHCQFHDPKITDSLLVLITIPRQLRIQARFPAVCDVNLDSQNVWKIEPIENQDSRNLKYISKYISKSSATIQ